MVEIVSQPLRPAPATHPRIMVVDDEPIVVTVLGLYLRRAGYQDVVSTSDSLATMQMIRKCRPDLLLIDLNMPGLSGFDILAEIGADCSLADLPVIVVTASCDDGTKARVRDLGAKTVLAKPIDEMDAIREVREALAS